MPESDRIDDTRVKYLVADSLNSKYKLEKCSTDVKVSEKQQKQSVQLIQGNEKDTNYKTLILDKTDKCFINNITEIEKCSTDDILSEKQQQKGVRSIKKNKKNKNCKTPSKEKIEKCLEHNKKLEDSNKSTDEKRQQVIKPVPCEDKNTQQYDNKLTYVEKCNQISQECTSISESKNGELRSALSIGTSPSVRFTDMILKIPPTHIKMQVSKEQQLQMNIPEKADADTVEREKDMTSAVKENDNIVTPHHGMEDEEESVVVPHSTSSTLENAPLEKPSSFCYSEEILQSVIHEDSAVVKDNEPTVNSSSQADPSEDSSESLVSDDEPTTVEDITFSESEELYEENKTDVDADGSEIGGMFVTSYEKEKFDEENEKEVDDCEKHNEEQHCIGNEEEAHEKSDGCQMIDAMDSNKIQEQIELLCDGNKKNEIIKFLEHKKEKGLIEEPESKRKEWIECMNEKNKSNNTVSNDAVQTLKKRKHRNRKRKNTKKVTTRKIQTECKPESKTKINGNQKLQSSKALGRQTAKSHGKRNRSRGGKSGNDGTTSQGQSSLPSTCGARNRTTSGRSSGGDDEDGDDNERRPRRGQNKVPADKLDEDGRTRKDKECGEDDKAGDDVGGAGDDVDRAGDDVGGAGDDNPVLNVLVCRLPTLGASCETQPYSVSPRLPGNVEHSTHFKDHLKTSFHLTQRWLDCICQSCVFVMDGFRHTEQCRSTQTRCEICKSVSEVCRLSIEQCTEMCRCTMPFCKNLRRIVQLVDSENWWNILYRYIHEYLQKQKHGAHQINPPGHSGNSSSQLVSSRCDPNQPLRRGAVNMPGTPLNTYRNLSVPLTAIPELQTQPIMNNNNNVCSHIEDIQPARDFDNIAAVQAHLNDHPILEQRNGSYHHDNGGDPHQILARGSTSNTEDVANQQLDNKSAMYAFIGGNEGTTGHTLPSLTDIRIEMQIDVPPTSHRDRFKSCSGAGQQATTMRQERFQSAEPPITIHHPAPHHRPAFDIVVSCSEFRRSDVQMFSFRWDRLSQVLRSGGRVPDDKEGAPMQEGILIHKGLECKDGRYTPGRHWRIEARIGSGKFGDCHLMCDMSTQFICAVKKCDLRDFTNNAEEVNIWCQLSHSGIPELYGILRIGTAIYYFMKYIRGMSVRSILELKPTYILQEHDILDFAYQISEILLYLHNKRIRHGDLKASNIMVDEQGYLYLVDFGFSRQLQKGHAHFPKNENPQGTPVYMAPEIALSNIHSLKVDIWAFGCLILHMLSGQPPWSSLKLTRAEQIYYAIGNNEPPLNEIPQECCEPLRKLVTWCLNRNPANRPTAMQCYYHWAFNRVFYEQDMLQNLDQTIDDEQDYDESVTEKIDDNVLSIPPAPVNDPQILIQKEKEEEEEDDIYSAGPVKDDDAIQPPFVNILAVSRGSTEGTLTPSSSLVLSQDPALPSSLTSSTGSAVSMESINAKHPGSESKPSILDSDEGAVMNSSDSDDDLNSGEHKSFDNGAEKPLPAVPPENDVQVLFESGESSQPRESQHIEPIETLNRNNDYASALVHSTHESSKGNQPASKSMIKAEFQPQLQAKMHTEGTDNCNAGAELRGPDEEAGFPLPVLQSVARPPVNSDHVTNELASLITGSIQHQAKAAVEGEQPGSMRQTPNDVINSDDCSGMHATNTTYNGGASNVIQLKPTHRKLAPSFSVNYTPRKKPLAKRSISSNPLEKKPALQHHYSSPDLNLEGASNYSSEYPRTSSMVSATSASSEEQIQAEFDSLQADLLNDVMYKTSPEEQLALWEQFNTTEEITTLTGTPSSGRGTISTSEENLSDILPPPSPEDTNRYTPGTRVDVYGEDDASKICSIRLLPTSTYREVARGISKKVFQQTALSSFTLTSKTRLINLHDELGSGDLKLVLVSADNGNQWSWRLLKDDDSIERKNEEDLFY
ncbi:uncharacterized protein LOC102808387 [Saccoglossus kowalevskii]|uniref:non-specific serine/threonine protein kinase n=1 Tax=Saccoglossus kowalevskii TaxID=10224 RepID=A0ABM0MET5_SACKO|nr:PREDICTED: uncharacterized protein LOC102808387 [Saccoglossus kowalevskii]